MTSRITLTPAHGRDYKSLAEVKADLIAGKDFVLSQWGSPWDGKPTNLTQLLEQSVSSVNVRYGKLRKIALLELKEELP